MAATIKGYADFLEKSSSFKAATAEFVATCALVLTGTASCVWALELRPASSLNVGLAALIVATVFGVAYTTLAYMTAHTSGAQINPAISLAMMCSGYLSLLQGVVNIVAQMLGAVLASVLLWVMLPHQLAKHSHLGANTLPMGSSVHGAFLAEMIGTLILTLVVLETRMNRKSMAGNAGPVAMGGALFFTLLAFGTFSSGCMNPARAFGPALVSFHMRWLWIFMIAPFLGALCAVPLHLLFESDWDTTSKDTSGPGPEVRRGQIHSQLEHLHDSAQPLMPHRGQRLADIEDPETPTVHVESVNVN